MYISWDFLYINMLPSRFFFLTRNISSYGLKMFHSENFKLHHCFAIKWKNTAKKEPTMVLKENKQTQQLLKWLQKRTLEIFCVSFFEKKNTYS